MVRASANATPSNVLWSSFRTITIHGLPVPDPGPDRRGFCLRTGGATVVAMSGWYPPGGGLTPFGGADTGAWCRYEHGSGARIGRPVPGTAGRSQKPSCSRWKRRLTRLFTPPAAAARGADLEHVAGVEVEAAFGGQAAAVQRVSARGAVLAARGAPGAVTAALAHDPEAAVLEHAVDPQHPVAPGIAAGASRPGPAGRRAA